MNITKIVSIVAAIGFVIAYLLGVFCETSFDPSQWRPILREGLAIAMGACSVVLLIVWMAFKLADFTKQ